MTGLIVDQQAALLGEGCIAPGSAKCTYGTGAFLLANTGEAAVRSSAGLTTSVAWRLRGQTPYCVDGQVYTAASAVRWLTELGLVVGADRAGRPPRQRTATVCCACRPWPGWPRPGGDSTATASFTGHDAEQRTAVSWCGPCSKGSPPRSPAWSHLIAADLGAPLTRLRVDGGLTRSARPDAGPGRPGPAAGRRLPLTRTPPPRRRRAVPGSPSTRPSTLADVVGGWAPVAHLRAPLVGRPGRRPLPRWQRAASAALGPVEPGR